MAMLTYEKTRNMRFEPMYPPHSTLEMTNAMLKRTMPSAMHEYSVTKPW